MTTSRAWAAARIAVGASLVGCFELSAPASDLSAISPIAVPWPAVVVGDSLRNAAGQVVPLHVDAYDGEGQLVTDVQVSYIALDRGLHVTPEGIVVGDSVRTSPVRIVALVRRGADVLQTPEAQVEARVDVVPRPDSVAPSRDTIFAPRQIVLTNPAPDSTELAVRVYSRRPGQAAVAVRSWIVRFEILTPLPPGANENQPTVSFGGAGNLLITADTTDERGLASRTVVLQTTALNANLLGRFEVRIRVSVGNTRPGGAPTEFTITLPFDRG